VKGGKHPLAAVGGTVTKLFPANEHAIERVLRVVLGLGVLSLAFIGPQSAWGYLGLVPLATGLLGSCPLYTLLGVSTCPVKNQMTHN
jgi:hypothetical protein